MKEYLTTEGDGLTITYSAPVGVDSVVYTISDLDLDEIIFADEASINNDDLYEFDLSSDICKYDRKLRIDIELLNYGTTPVYSSTSLVSSGTNGSYNTDFLDISLVRPYVTADELAEELGLTIVAGTPADTSEVKRATIERWERQARMFINSKIDEKVRLQYKTVTVVGQDTDVLYLDGNRVESFDKITKDDEVVFDTQEDINLLTYTLEISKSKLQLKPYYVGANIDEGKAMSAIYDPGYFERGSIYSVRGEYGWKNVPEELREATIILVDDMRCNDWSYRNKGLKSVKNDSFDIEYNDIIFSGTGNILVDSLISEFKSIRMFAI
jgi:hypothetical protein